MNKKENKILIKIGDFIVNFKYAFLGIFIILAVFGLYNFNNVGINENITSYLPDNTETKRGLDIMKKEFGELNELQVLLTNVSYEKATDIKQALESIDNVQTIFFDETEDYYKEGDALLVIQLTDMTDSKKEETLNHIQEVIKNQEYYLYDAHSNVVGGINLILAITVVVIITVIVITSKSYFDVVLAFIIFGISIILNKGSNFLLGNISFITNSIAVVLQLGLSLDYFIIFMSHYMKETNDTTNLDLAIKKTVSKSIPEIFASSLTTIAGLLALIFMTFKLGGDIGIVMSKGIICSFLTVICLLPCLTYIFNKPIQKCKHKLFSPNIHHLSEGIVNSRKVVLPIFLLIISCSLFMISKYQFSYDINAIIPFHKGTNMIAKEKITDEFGNHNKIVVLLKNSSKDYLKELELTNELKKISKVTSVTSLGGYEFSPTIYLGSQINASDFSQLYSLPIEKSSLLFQMYARDNNELEQATDLQNYRITIIDLVKFLNDNRDKLGLTENLNTMLTEYNMQIEKGKSLLETDQYTRMIIEINTEVESNETFSILDEIKTISHKYYDEVTLTGNSVSVRDLSDTFESDNMIITMVTILFIAVILLFTFKSVGMTILLILTIEGSILTTFALITLAGTKMFFISYIIVSAIQMGATIDYAIVLSNRYESLRTKFDKKKALVNTLQDSLPAILTSGLILIIVGFLIGYISDSGVVASIGLFLGIGTLISVIVTIFILPAILYACDKFINVTKF